MKADATTDAKPLPAPPPAPAPVAVPLRELVGTWCICPMPGCRHPASVRWAPNPSPGHEVIVGRCETHGSYLCGERAMAVPCAAPARTTFDHSL